jgi:hypothetical protein
MLNAGGASAIMASRVGMRRAENSQAVIDDLVRHNICNAPLRHLLLLPILALTSGSLEPEFSNPRTSLIPSILRALY